jgi:hypothetical protein
VTSGDDILGQVLRASHQMEPGELVAVVAAAVKELGGRDAAVLLVDYEQRLLIPFEGSDGDPAAVEATLVGRAFITGQMVDAAVDAGVQVWAPLVDGSERLGVLGAVFDVVDDATRAALIDVAALVAELLQTKRAYTDVVERTMRQREVTLASELLWSLLPPLTFSTRRVAVSGILEPAYAIGGDAFDYAVNGDTADVVVIDAMGHGMPAVVPAVVALAALRRARRHGLDLPAMYVEADRAVRNHVGHDVFVTAQLARLDLTSGLLRWVNAGHPAPMLVRDGHVSTAAACAPSLPLGLGGEVDAMAEIALQPWDRLVFFTDGVTEGRRSPADMFGEERLAEVLSKESLAGHGVAETLRRTAHAVLDHHAHDLRDDFTLMAVEYRAGDVEAAEPRLARRPEHDTSL